MDKDYFQKLTSLGIDGIVSSKAKLNILGEAIIKVCGGEKYFCKYVKRIFPGEMNNSGSKIKLLTKMEREVCILAKQGWSNKDIAEKLHRSVRTVEEHKLHAKRKLCLSSYRGLFEIDF